MKYIYQRCTRRGLVGLRGTVAGHDLLRRYCLGSYRQFEDAVRARRETEESLHGGFLREFAGADPNC